MLHEPWTLKRTSRDEEEKDDDDDASCSNVVGLPFGVMFQNADAPLVCVTPVVHLAAPTDIYPVKLPGTETTAWMRAFMGPPEMEEEIVTTIERSAYRAGGYTFSLHSPSTPCTVTLGDEKFLLSLPLITAGRRR